jgi:4-amino-4-deoxy-L-arabinose transferase-like glycosyltransferase
MSYIKKSNYCTEITFILFIFILYLCWAIVQPFNSAPDEQMRYQIAEFIFKNGTLPHGGDPSIRNEIWGISYGFTPILSYIIGAFFMKFSNIISSDSFALLLSARMVSIFASTGTVFVSMKISKKLFKDLYQWIFIILIAALPQFIFISSYVNTDSLAIFSTSLIVYAWIIGLETNWNYKSCTLLGTSISLCALSYYNSYGFILCSIILFIISELFLSKTSLDYVNLLKKGIFISFIVVIFAGWWFLRNYLIYDGDFLGMKTSNMYGDLYAIDKYKPSNIATPQREGKSILYMIFNMGWLKLTSASFIGLFGFMSIKLFNWMYAVYISIFSLGIIGVINKLKSIVSLKKYSNSKKRLLFNVCMFISAIIPNILNIIYSYTTDFEPQGRYSLPMLIPFMYFITLGLNNLIEGLCKSVTKKKIILYTISAICILIGILCFTNIIIPTYLN